MIERSIGALAVRV